jgi:hypothetical protein
MGHLSGYPNLVAEPGECCLPHLTFSQKLQRDRLVENQVEGAVHLAHPAIAQVAENAITTG